MDKKELLKRWALAYTEPSLFYVPWKKSKKKSYYEYVTIVFKYAIPTFSSKDWARVPVFGVYLVNDDKSETLVYSTALYDEDNHLIRNGIVTDSTSYFFISGDHGRTNRALVKEGNFKIRMLCSGSGMITNNVYEWDFEVKRGASGTIYDTGYYEVSYHTITIDPFKGSKYLEIEYEPTLVKKYTTADIIEQCKTIYSIDEFGDSSRLRWAYDEYGQKARLISYFGLSTESIGTILPDLQDDIYFYDVKIQFNEKFFEYKTNSKTVLSHRGTKKLVNDKLELKEKGTIKYLEYTNASTIAQYALDYSNIDFDYSYHTSYLPSFSAYDLNPVGVDEGYSCRCDIFDPDVTYVGGQLIYRIRDIPLSDINSYYTAGQQKSITLYCNRNRLSVKKNYNKSYSAHNDNLSNVSNRDERFMLFQELDQECRAYFQKSFKEHLEKNSSTAIRDIGEISLPLESIITNVLPDAYKKEYTYDPDWHYDLHLSDQNNDYSGIYEISRSEPVTVIGNVFGFQIIDMGIDYTNYEHYEDIDSWVGNTLGNPEIEIYHPELIPKEKEGES